MSATRSPVTEASPARYQITGIPAYAQYAKYPATHSAIETMTLRDCTDIRENGLIFLRIRETSATKIASVVMIDATAMPKKQLRMWLLCPFCC